MEEELLLNGFKQLLSTHEDWIRGRTYHYAILGDIKDLDMDFLRTLGPVTIVTPEEMFGY